MQWAILVAQLTEQHPDAAARVSVNIRYKVRHELKPKIPMRARSGRTWWRS